MTAIAQTARPTPRLDIGAPFSLGLSVIILFFVLGVGGAAFAPIDKGVGVPGQVIVESKTKPVAHLRGGTVEKIHVIEGQDVEAGDLLVSLETHAFDEQIQSLNTQRSAALRQLELARQEAETIRGLEERKLAARSKMLAIERMVAEIEKDVASYEAKILAIKADREKSEIRAPVSGRIMSLQVHAPGAVVQPGLTVAELVPRSDKLVIEGKLLPTQIENVVPGMDAKVWLSALSWREQRPLPAKLSWISPDSVEDKRTGASYFVARIELQPVEDPNHAPVKLQAGMRAEVLLLTGQRTLLDQLIDPLMRNVHKAFHG